MKITKEQLKQIVREELASLAEAKVSSSDKKQFQSDAQEILDNLIKAKLLDDSTSMQTAYNSLLSVFSAIVNGPDSANYSKVKKYLPRKLNHDLYDNGEGNSYDSVWMSQNDAQRSTVFKKAIKAKLNLSEESIHEDTDKEYPIWGIPPGKSSEELLYTKATSKRQASAIARALTDKHKCTKVRIQVLDLAQDPSDIWDTDKLFKEGRKVSYFGYKPDQIYYTPHIMDSGKFSLWKVMTFDDSPPFSTYKLPGGKKQDFKFFKDVKILPRGAVSIKP